MENKIKNELVEPATFQSLPIVTIKIYVSIKLAQSTEQIWSLKVFGFDHLKIFFSRMLRF